MDAAQRRKLFKGVGNAKPLKDGNWIRPGVFWARIDKCKMIENRKNQTRALAEMTVVHVVEEMRDQNQDKPHFVGEEITYMMRQDSEYFDREVAGFICACLGMDPESASEEEKIEAAVEVFGDDNPLEGTIVEISARETTTRDGKPFTKISFKEEVDPSKLLEVLDEKDISRLFPNGRLDHMINAYQQTHAAS